MPDNAAHDPLSGFGMLARGWFNGSFTGPTQAQSEAWQAISGGEHVLVVAPTGSGKTLAAFLHSLDRLVSTPSTGGVRVLYVSPLKALAVDVERNLRVPLRGMQAEARRLGLPEPTVRVAVRSGDTSAAERRVLLRNPPDILITTPESLFLMLSSQAAETLSSVETLIVDEVHALAGTKRGAHLAISLERLSGTGAGPQRIGLSATVNPTQQVAGFLGGNRPVRVIEPKAEKHWQTQIVVPLDDMTELRRMASPQQQDTSNSIWPWIEPRILELIDQHRSTICFCNSRRVAERLTSHLNELHALRLGAEKIVSPPPAQLMAQTDRTTGHDGTHFPVIARAHHGSVSKERRLEIEHELKTGELKCVVATSSLELGIDMGAVDLVIQVQAPPSVSSALQRVGRAGHQVGAVSRGVLFPTARGDLLECTVIVDRMLAGAIEPLPLLRNPLDVLAQQLVSICLTSPRTADDLYTLVRQAEPFSTLPRSAFDGVLDMLCGRYPSEDFAGLRPRLARDQRTGLLSARPGARQLVTTSGGTIPDRGLFGVFLVGSGIDERGGARRVGELDEEMVHESRVGDVFTLGTTSWRVEEINANQVLVSPAPGVPGRLPFWHGDGMGRPRELGQAIGEAAARLAADPDAATEALAVRTGLDPRAVVNLKTYVADQARATGLVPDANTIVVERFRDEVGDWRVCVLSSLGSPVLAPLSMLLRHRLREQFGIEPDIVVSNDGIVVRVADVDAEPPGAELLTGLDPDQVTGIIEDEVRGSSLFAARFRECAARALLLPRRRPGQRSPLWQQRLRATQLLGVASRYPDFPIVLETMRECLNDVFDLPGLVGLLHQIRSRRVQVVAVETESPSPFARHVMFGFAGAFMYDGDQPDAERRLASLTLDPGLLDELLGRESLAEFFDAALIEQVESELQRTAPGWRAGDAEQLWDVLRTIGPLTEAELGARADADPDEAAGWLNDLAAAGRVRSVRLGDLPALIVSEDAELLADLAATDERVAAAARARLLDRWTRTRVATEPAGFADRYGIALPRVESMLLDRAAEGSLVQSEYLPDKGPLQFCHREVLSRLKRRMLARLRADVEPVNPRQLARFLARWHELDAPGRGTGALAAAVDQLAGVPIAASMLESVVLPARVDDYQPAMLDELLADGSVRWTGHGRLGERDGWVQLWPGDVSLAASSAEVSALARSLLDRLEAGGAWRAADLVTPDTSLSAVEAALWELAWAGLAGTDSFGAVRQWCGQKVLRRVQAPRPRRRALPRAIVLPQSSLGGVRWSAVVRGTLPAAEQLVQDVGLLLGRHGVLTKAASTTEVLTSGFGEVYRVSASLEERGALRRGYFVEGLGGAQFALPGAVDLLRESAATPPLLLAASDPANPYGAALAWPISPAHRPNRGAGSLVLLDDGALIAYLERGARTLLCFTEAADPRLATALGLLGAGVASGRIDELTIEQINGQPALENSDHHQALTAAGFVMVPQGFRRRRTSTTTFEQQPDPD